MIPTVMLYQYNRDDFTAREMPSHETIEMTKRELQIFYAITTLSTLLNVQPNIPDGLSGEEVIRRALSKGCFDYRIAEPYKEAIIKPLTTGDIIFLMNVPEEHIGYYYVNNPDTSWSGLEVLRINMKN
jgi:hypothetical protein